MPAPLAWVQCWIGIPAIAWLQQSSAAALKNLMSRSMVLEAFCFSMTQARRGRARFAVGIDRLRPQNTHGELFVAEILRRHRFDLVCRDGPQALDQALVGIQGQAL